MGSYAGYLVETFVTLLAVCSLAFVVLYGARKLGVGRARGPLELVGQLPLDARRQIVLVRVGSQVIMVGVGDGGFTKLAEIPASELPRTDATTPGSRGGAPFNDVLARVLGTERIGRGHTERGAGEQRADRAVRHEPIVDAAPPHAPANDDLRGRGDA